MELKGLRQTKNLMIFEKLPRFHAGNRGSNPLGDATIISDTYPQFPQNAKIPIRPTHEAFKSNMEDR